MKLSLTMELNDTLSTWSDVAIALGFDPDDLSTVQIGQAGIVQDDSGAVVGHWEVTDV